MEADAFGPSHGTSSVSEDDSERIRARASAVAFGIAFLCPVEVAKRALFAVMILLTGWSRLLEPWIIAFLKEGINVKSVI